ncbi:hypothetical protein LCGC14_0549500 [marine sediment metagenome]|uniref:Nuclease associated modular domain-containing protein n=1 Tax=marine sediment metagenome TaxID=412755 RepID=A0A0F9RV70_9ZZZZ
MRDLIGRIFGRLDVVERADNSLCGKIRWLCICSCGKTKIVAGHHLKSGATKSCGCLNIEKIIERSTKHGHRRQKRSKTYISWMDMIQRCTNTKNKFYHNYGGRGIKVCKRWRKSFENFLEDMGEVQDRLQLDRIDNDKGYCKSNCRWTTSKMNNRNRRNNHLETYGGKTQCLATWADEFNINYDMLYLRLKRGWTIEEALTTPSYQKREK